MKYIKDFIYSAFSGIISLVLINLCGSYIGAYLTVSYINLSVSALLGIPGVIGLLIFNNILI